ARRRKGGSQHARQGNGTPARSGYRTIPASTCLHRETPPFRRTAEHKGFGRPASLSSRIRQQAPIRVPAYWRIFVTGRGPVRRASGCFRAEGRETQAAGEVGRTGLAAHVAARRHLDDAPRRPVGEK